MRSRLKIEKPNFHMDQAANSRIVLAARNLSTKVIEYRDQAEAIRQTPKPLVEALAKEGLYQMFLPRSAGGPELSPFEAFYAIEQLSRADGSVGWNAMIASGLSILAGRLAPEIVRTMCGAPANIRIAGSLRPEAKAVPCEGGYKVSGNFSLGSGIDSATWLHCPAIIYDGDKPAVTDNGAPKVRTMFISAKHAKIIDNWSVMGMRGTGSKDFSIDSVFVPTAYSYSLSEPAVEKGPLYHSRFWVTAFYSATAANALGMARGAIDSLIELSQANGSTLSKTTLKDRHPVQAKIGEAEAILQSGRAYLLDSLSKAWEAVRQDPQHITTEIAHARLAIAHSMHEAVRAVDLVFHAAAANAIYCKNPIERYFRDIHVAAQHNAAFPSHYEVAGKVFLGLSVSDPGW